MEGSGSGGRACRSLDLVGGNLADRHGEADGGAGELLSIAASGIGLLAFGLGVQAGSNDKADPWSSHP